MNTDIKTHYSDVRQVLVIVLILNWAVAAAKIAYGLMTRCSSMAADGLHSLSDGTSNIIGLIGLRFCAKPTDQDHPYGHRKYETLFSLGIAGLLIIVTLDLIKEGIKRISHPIVPEINIQSFLVMIITMGVNIWVMRYEYKRGKSLKSDILVVDSMHTRADIFTSAAVIVTLIGVKLGYPLSDPIATLLIAVFIAKAAFDIIKQEAGILCDAVAITDVKRIEDMVLGVTGVMSCHKIRTRGRPDDIYIDLHVQLEPETHLDKAHKISYEIEDIIKKAIPEVADVLVHLEPREKGRKKHVFGKK